MKTNANDPINQPHFNSTASIEDREYIKGKGILTGLSKREYFAAMALQGICAEFSSHSGHELEKSEDYARQAVRCADALINALNQQTI